MVQPSKESVNVSSAIDTSSSQQPSTISSSSGRQVIIGPPRIAAGAKIDQTIRVPSDSNRPDVSQKRSLSQTPHNEPVASDAKVQAILQRREPKLQQKIDAAKLALTDHADELSFAQISQRLKFFTQTLKEAGCWTWNTLPAGALFSDIACPCSTQIAKVHANWLDDDRKMAGFMYPSLKTRGQVLEAFMTEEIRCHAHLGHDFVVWLQQPTTGPVFPMSAEKFEKLHGEHVLQTELGPIKVTYGQITTDASGQKNGLITVASKDQTRTHLWPLDSLVIRPGLRLEVDPSQEPQCFVYKDEQNKPVHTLRVETILWQDYKGQHVSELHKLAISLAKGPKSSAGCRAGVGRTGTLFVAVKMLEWTKANPGRRLTNQRLLDFIAEGRLNRDPQVVQTDEQLMLLMDYMTYLNADPSLPLADKARRFLEELGIFSRESERLKSELAALILSNDQIRAWLADPSTRLDAENEARLDEIFQLISDPISFEPMKEPVRTVHGHTFDKSIIEAIIRKDGICPLTRRPLTLDMLTPDLCVQHLNELLTERSGLVLPTSDVGKAARDQVERITIRDPLPWCRLVSAVMPRNYYFIRRKVACVANDYVLEYRLSDKVQKCSFHVTQEGKIQPTMYPALIFSSVDEMAHWIGRGALALCLTQESIGLFNKSAGKSTFMQHLYRDTNLMNIVRHLEQRFEDNTVSDQIKRQGYVRASIQPASFPCFTHVRYETMPDSSQNVLNKMRYGIVNGAIFKVAYHNLSGVTDVASCREKINNSILDDEAKRIYLDELEKVKNDLDFSAGVVTVTLFAPSNELVTGLLPLGSISESQARKVHRNGYALLG